MEPSNVVIMEKDKETGFLTKELGSYTMEKVDYIRALHAEEEAEELIVSLVLSTERDLDEWEYSAVFDYYDTEIFSAKNLKVEDIEDSFNPEWKIKFKFIENRDTMEKLLNTIVNMHEEELSKVYDEIKDKMNEYV